jgi:hypothetical protein
MANKKSVDEYVADLQAWQAEIVTALRKLIREAAPNASEAIKWAQPVFEENGPFAFIRPASKHVTIGFWRGAEMADPKGVFEGEGDRMKHIKLTAVKDIQAHDVQSYVREAVALNRQHGDPTKKRKS